MNAKVYCESMEEYYLALHDAVELRGEIWKVLTALADDYACPAFDEVPNITTLVLDLFVCYAQICLMLTNVSFCPATKRFVLCCGKCVSCSCA